MIEIKNVKVDGFEAAIRGMRNPLNSWHLIDSSYDENGNYIIGENDMGLMKRLADAGTEHRKYLRMITVTFDITAPTYWFSEFDTYKVGVTRNSTSFMHKGTAKPFERSDFEIDNKSKESKYMVMDAWTEIIATLNELRDEYLEFKDIECFRAMRQLLPMSYKYTSTISLNYEVLLNMYKQRKSHRLKEWRDFCDWIESLPYMNMILDLK